MLRHVVADLDADGKAVEADRRRPVELELQKGKRERWNLGDVVLVSSHAGLVLAADTNTFIMSTVYP